jgi:integrase/recombinase XerC
MFFSSFHFTECPICKVMCGKIEIYGYMGCNKLKQNTLRKERDRLILFPDQRDRLEYWMEQYILLAVEGIKSNVQKVELHLNRFREFFLERYGHDRVSAITQRDVVKWQADLYDDGEGWMPSTVNGHLASLSGFTSWLTGKAPHLLPMGDPAKGIREIDSLPLVARSLTDRQVDSLKNLCDRLERFYAKRDRKRFKGNVVELRKTSRPNRDRAMVYILLSTGLRREELTEIDLEQVVPKEPNKLSVTKICKIRRVKGKGGTEREVFLSKDARQALADYIEKERPRDVTEGTAALFLSAVELPARKVDGRLSVQAVNQLLSKIGRWHDAEFPDRSMSPLRPHDLRHTFAYRLVKEGADEFELERRLGHRSRRYIQIYTQGPEEVSAGYVENL